MTGSRFSLDGKKAHILIAKHLLVACTFLLCTLFASASFGIDAGDKMKDFALRDAKGEITCLGRILGESDVVVLELLTAYCYTCREKVPLMNRIAHEYRSKGVRVLGVSVGDSQEKVDRFVEELGVRYPILADPERTTYYLYDVHEVPIMYLIDSFGIIRYREFPTQFEDVEQEIKKALAKRDGILQAGDVAPDFTLPNIDGEMVDSEAFTRHHKAVLGFFSGDTAEYQELANVMERIHQEYRDQEVNIVGILSEVSDRNIAQVAATYPVTFPLLLDVEGKAATESQVSRSPRVFVINEVGRIRRMGSHISYSELRKALGEREGPDFALSPEETGDILRKAMPQAESFVAVHVNGGTIYVGRGRGGAREYGRFVAKDVLCDVCSDVHFIYTLDASGVIRNIVMIESLELYGTPIEGTEFLQQFIGRSYHETLVPGENVDVIAGATKSSLKIIEGLNETETVFSKYVSDPDFDAPFRREVCFRQETEIEWAMRCYEVERGQPMEELDLQWLTAHLGGGTIPNCPSGGSYELVNFNNILRVMCTVHRLDPCSSAIY
jgi:peroxiredoxin